MSYELIHGDCLEAMPRMADSSIDSIITDPPYELDFMGKKWDSSGVAFSVDLWAEALRVAKPGAILMAFGGTRTYHRMTCAIEDAGWEIRDCIMYMYGSGFPKSANIGKLIDKSLGAEREVLRTIYNYSGETRNCMSNFSGNRQITTPATRQAERFDGHGTALKPAYEPIVVAMKPIDKNYAHNAILHGVAGLNIDECRVGDEEITHQGRWPANVVIDGSPEALAGFPYTCSGKMSGGQQRNVSKGEGGYHGNFPDEATSADTYGDSGSASRFFYTSKAGKSEREIGLDAFDATNVNDGRTTSIDNAYQRGDTQRKNTHPTVKPLDLMEYLCKLTKTPAGGVVLDPFAGSGTTGIACQLSGRDFIGIEQSAEYIEIARARIEYAVRYMQRRGLQESTAEAMMSHQVDAAQMSIFDMAAAA